MAWKTTQTARVSPKPKHSKNCTVYSTRCCLSVHVSSHCNYVHFSPWAWCSVQHSARLNWTAHSSGKSFCVKKRIAMCAAVRIKEATCALRQENVPWENLKRATSIFPKSRIKMMVMVLTLFLGSGHIWEKWVDECACDGGQQDGCTSNGSTASKFQRFTQSAQFWKSRMPLLLHDL